jgi:hypothetical protein
MAASQNVVQLRSTRVTTTDGTIVTASVFTPKVNRGYVLVATVIASDGSTTASYGRVATFENSGGTVTQVSTTTSLWTHEDIAAPMDFVFSISGSDVLLRVTGDPGRTINWVVNCDIYDAGPGA